MARVVAVTLGLDTVPGTTITRYCSSSVQTTRMAMHAIRAGEGHVFISAGVEAVSRAARGTADNPPVDPTADPRSRAGNPWTNIIFERAQGGVGARLPAARGLARPAAGRRAARRLRRDGADRRERGRAALGVQGRAGRVRLPFAESRRSRCGGRLLEAEITPLTMYDGTVIDTDDCPRAGTTLEGLAGLKPVFRPDGTITAGNACPLNDGAAALVIMSDTRAAELGITPLARVIATGVSALSPEIMGLGPVEASRKALAWPA